MGVVAWGIAASLAASGAAGLPSPDSHDQTGSQIDWGWEWQESDAGLEPVTTISVPADAVFEFSPGQASSKPPPEPEELSETWAHPLPSGRLLSQYGNRGIIPGVTTSAFHNGIDLAAPAGTEILAAGSGTVTYAAQGNRVLGLTGWVVVIEHLDGTSTAYNHMYASGVLVKIGDTVSAGDVIALVGSSGRSTGPHLHFSCWVDGRAVNPVNYLRERGVKVPGGRATKGEVVIGDPYEWDWAEAPVPVGDPDPIEEPIGHPEPDPVEQTPKPEKPEKPEKPQKPAPTPDPTEEPTEPPTEDPTEPPTEDPTEDPTEPPTEDPTGEPTPDPSEPPTEDPTGEPTPGPSAVPSEDPSPTPSESATP